MNALTQEPELWNKPAKAKALMKEKTLLENAVSACSKLEKETFDTIELIELAELEKDNGILKEAEDNLLKIQKEVAQKELEALLSGEADSNDSYLEIHSGSGGTEAQDWAEMLLRMYTRWAEQHNYKVEYVEEQAGDVAGIKSVTIKIIGENAYGWLKTESGVHRLVRISPFDSSARRHTSFA